MIKIESKEEQSIYRMFKNCVETDEGMKVSKKIGSIKELELDKTTNYILIPVIVKDKVVHWHCCELHKNDDVRFKPNHDEDKWCP